MLLIKVEAINIWKFIGDSNDLSTSRGAGLMLLQLPERFKNWLAATFPDAAPTKITSGASKAVFQLTHEDPAGLEAQARTWLTGEYPHATIGLAVHKPEGQWKFYEEDEKLTSSIRLSQMQGFSVAPIDPPQAAQVCEVDKVRPANQQAIVKDRPAWVSPSVIARRAVGAVEKQRFLHQEAGLPEVDANGARWRYTHELDTLSADQSRGTLHHKIALFYFDGNSFGKNLRKKLSSVSGEKQVKGIGEFDNFLQGKRRIFLGKLLQATDASRWQTTAGERRIELLLWGGDEGLLIVPAWCGWETAAMFCEVMNAAGNAPVLNAPLKHGMALVFAHHNAPIHALRRLAHDLVEHEAKSNRAINQLSYLTLESFDHVGEDLARFRSLRVPLTGAQLALNAEAGNLTAIRNSIRLLQQKEFPRRKIYQAVLAIARQDPEKVFAKEVLRFVDKAGCRTEFDTFCGLAGGPKAAWCHLAELWDYLEA